MDPTMIYNFMPAAATTTRVCYISQFNTNKMLLNNSIIVNVIVASFLVSLLLSIPKIDAAGLNNNGQIKNRDVYIEHAEDIVKPKTVSMLNTFVNHRESIIPKEINQYECGKSMSMKKDNIIDADDIETNFKLKRKYKPMEFRRPRIVGGDETRPGEFPWIASIKLGEQPICGGSLINRDWVLTAAHCVVGYSPKSLSIRLGAFRIKDNDEEHSVERNISLFVVHRDYSNPRPFSNDIALIKLAKSVDYSDYIIPICMPEKDQLSASINNSNNSIGSFNNSSENANKNGMKDIESNEVIPSTISNDKLMPDGIVITDKMSDIDIVRSLYHLEQNYLASMGLASDSMINFGVEFVIKSVKQESNNDNNYSASDNVDLKEEYIKPTIESYHGINGTVVGWGWIKDVDMSELVNKGYPSSILQKVELPILRNDDCELWFQSQGKKITLLASQFCAGYRIGGKDACRGDSGGPMVKELPNQKYLLIGIVSAGIGCARPGLPGLYTRVASYMDWIDVHMEKYHQ